MKKNLFIFLLVFVISIPALAKEAVKQISADPSDFEQVRPILDQKCAICHASASSSRPFSSKIPVWNHMTGTNIKLARKKYDIDGLLQNGNFASEGHMKMLEHTMLKKNMPPFQYRMFHLKKRISSEERQTILAWIYANHPEWKGSE